jgi:hypothetical protein
LLCVVRWRGRLHRILRYRAFAGAASAQREQISGRYTKALGNPKECALALSLNLAPAAETVCGGASRYKFVSSRFFGADIRRLAP